MPIRVRSPPCVLCIPASSVSVSSVTPCATSPPTTLQRIYAGLGWRLDADFPFDNGFRVVQFTPPGSGSSVQFGTRITTAAPGSAQGLYLVVSDIQAARDELAARGAEVSEVFHPGAPGAQFEADAGERVGGPAAERASYSSFATFHDPDGNTLAAAGGHHPPAGADRPGRDDVRRTRRTWPTALRRAAAAHGEHEKRTGEADANWPDWYAAYMVAEQAGTELPT